MPVTVSKMATNEASLTVTGGLLGDDTLNLVYYPNKLTTANINTLDSGVDGTNQALSEVIKSWDLLEYDDGPMRPIDPDSLAKLGIGFLRQVAWAIMRDIRPK
jgi:hypothetical protein